MTEQTIALGQTWRRNSDGALVEVVEQAIDPAGYDPDDWKVRNTISRRTSWIFGYNLRRRYTLVPEGDQK